MQCDLFIQKVQCKRERREKREKGRHTATSDSTTEGNKRELGVGRVGLKESRGDCITGDRTRHIISAHCAQISCSFYLIIFTNNNNNGNAQRKVGQARTKAVLSGQ